MVCVCVTVCTCATQGHWTWTPLPIICLSVCAGDFQGLGDKKKVKTLAQLFQPPLDLIFPGTFREVGGAGAKTAGGGVLSLCLVCVCLTIQSLLSVSQTSSDCPNFLNPNGVSPCRLVYTPAQVFMCLSMCLSICLSVCLSACLSVCLLRPAVQVPPLASGSW